MMFNFYIIISILSIISVLLLTILLGIQENKNQTMKSFFWLGVITFIWMVLDLATSFTFLNRFQLLLIWRIGFIAALTFSLLTLYLVITFLSKTLDIFWAGLIFVFWFLLGSLIFFTNTVIKDLSVLKFPGQSNYIRGNLFPLIALIILIPFLISFIYLSQALLQKKKIRGNYQNKEIIYLLIGLLWPAIIALTTNIVFPILNIDLPKLTNISVLMGVIFFTIAIYKGKFLSSIVKNFKIKTNIILPIISTATVVLVLSSLYSYNFNSKLIRDLVNKRLETAISVKTYQLNTVLSAYQQRVRLITSKTWLKNYLRDYLDSYQEEDKLKVQKIINDVRQENQKFLHILIANPQGKVIIASDDNFIGQDFSQNDSFIKAKTDYVISDLHALEYDGSRLNILGPLILDNKLLGVVIISSDAKTLETAISKNAGLGNNGETYLLNKDSYMITASKFKKDVFLKEKVSTQQSNLCLQNNNFSNNSQSAKIGQVREYSNYIGHKVLGIYSYIPQKQWCLLSEIDEAEVLLPINNLLKFSLIRVVIVLFIFFIVAYLLARAVSKPIKELQKGVDIIEKGDLDYKVGTDSKDEIGDLSRSFDRLVFTLKKTQLAIKEKVKQQTKNIVSQQEDMDNQQAAILNILEDVEEEKKKTLSLAEGLEKFKLAVDNASDHIVITDNEGLILYANQAVERITGYTRSEIIGQKAGSKENWGGLMDTNLYRKLWKTIKTNKKNFSGDIKNKRKDGTEYDAWASISPVLNRDKKVIFFVGIERDITQEKNIDRAKTEFVSLASHQLRTPLSAINWYAEMLLNGDAGKISTEQKDYLREIYTGNQRMIELVNSLLNVSRLELGTFMVNPKLTNIYKLSDLIIKELSPKIRKRSIKFTKNYDPKLPKIMLDQELMIMIFQNLLSNAVKYTPARGKINLSIKKYSKTFLIKVQDTGYGIPKTQQSKIFSKLFRADNIREKDTEGTGLGLYIIKSIVDNSRGRIWFDSEVNKGSTFYVEMPLSGMKKKDGSRQLT